MDPDALTGRALAASPVGIASATAARGERPWFLRPGPLGALLLAGPAVFSLDVLRAWPANWPHGWPRERVATALGLAFVGALGKFLLWTAAAAWLWRLMPAVRAPGRALALVRLGLGAFGVAAVVSVGGFALQTWLRPALLAAVPEGSRGALVSSWAAATANLHTSFVMTLPWDLLTAFAVLAAVALSHFALHARDRERAALALAHELDHAHLHALEAQLRPHFLFNALNTVAAQIDRDPTGAKNLVGSLERLFGRLLAARAPESTRLGEELALVEHYVGIERARFGDRLRFTTSIAPGCAEAWVPSLLLQPLVENAIRHGVAARARPVHIHVHAALVGDELHLGVADDGPGCPGGPASGIGLASTRARLAARYGRRHQFRFVGSAAGGGARVEIDLPFARGPADPAAPVDAAPAAVATTDPAAEAPAGAAGRPAWQLGWALFALAMFVLNLVWCSARHFAAAPGGLTWFETVLVGGRGALAWTLLFPLVAATTTRLAAARLAPVARIAAHAGLALLVALAKASLVRALALLGGPLAAQPIFALFIGRIHSDLLHYAVMVGLAHAALQHARERAHARAAARLQAALVTTRLQALRLKLEPAFLLETLAALGALVTDAPARAERLVARTGDLLRQLLRERAAAAVPLADELRFVAIVCEIESLRAPHPVPPPRFEVPPAARLVPVPARLLALPLLREPERGRAARPGFGGYLIRAHFAPTVATSNESGGLILEVTTAGEPTAHADPGLRFVVPATAPAEAAS